MTYILFGLPGAGKTYVGRVFQKHFNFYVYDGDVELPENMRSALNSQRVITNTMRDEFFQRLLDLIQKLHKKHPNLVITQTYIKEKYRKKVLGQFPDIKFILVETETTRREKRLAERKGFPLDPEYARKMCELFDAPHIPHMLITNNEDGEESIKKQFASIFPKGASDNNMTKLSIFSMRHKGP